MKLTTGVVMFALLTALAAGPGGAQPGGPGSRPPDDDRIEQMMKMMQDMQEQMRGMQSRMQGMGPMHSGMDEMMAMMGQMQGMMQQHREQMGRQCPMGAPAMPPR